MTTNAAHKKAYRQAVLWPPIHAATDVFLKRQAAGAEPYEVAWRLIHIWECTAVTLASTGVSRVLTLPTADTTDQRILREKLYGVSWDPTEQSLESTVGALSHGSINKWIEILQFLASIDPCDSPYLQQLVAFLSGSDPKNVEGAGVDLSALVTAWSRACEVTGGVRSQVVSPLEAFRAINSFRNRLAHVPFPYDAMRGIAEALVEITEHLFSAHPAATSSSGPMRGVIVHNNWAIQGLSTNETSFFNEPGPNFVFGLTKSDAGECWSARPFIHIDGMFRPYVLTRVRIDSADWEYTRFLAEANAVSTIRNLEMFDALPIPEVSDYLDDEESADGSPIDPEGEPQEPTVRDMGDVAALMRDRRFAPAIAYLENRTKEQPSYHVGWLRLGHALREKAVDAYNSGDRDIDQIKELLDSSLDALQKAKGHSSRDYKAEAEYHISKSLYRRWQIASDEKDLLNAIAHAEQALRYNPLERYQTWSEFLKTLTP